jgi:hypothetical protein
LTPARPGATYRGCVERWSVGDPIDVVRGRFGEIALYELQEPVAILALARGIISFPMVRRDIEHAAAFGRAHPEGWCYLADIRGVRLLDPRNILALRRISSLAGLRRYVVVAPSWVARLARLAPGEVTTTVDDALRRCRR